MGRSRNRRVFFPGMRLLPDRARTMAIDFIVLKGEVLRLKGIAVSNLQCRIAALQAHDRMALVECPDACGIRYLFYQQIILKRAIFQKLFARDVFERQTGEIYGERSCLRLILRPERPQSAVE